MLWILPSHPWAGFTTSTKPIVCFFLVLCATLQRQIVHSGYIYWYNRGKRATLNPEGGNKSNRYSMGVELKFKKRQKAYEHRLVTMAMTCNACIRKHQRRRREGIRLSARLFRLPDLTRRDVTVDGCLYMIAGTTKDIEGQKLYPVIRGEMGLLVETAHLPPGRLNGGGPNDNEGCRVFACVCLGSLDLSA